MDRYNPTEQLRQQELQKFEEARRKNVRELARCVVSLTDSFCYYFGLTQADALNVLATSPPDLADSAAYLFSALPDGEKLQDVARCALNTGALNTGMDKK